MSCNLNFNLIWRLVECSDWLKTRNDARKMTRWRISCFCLSVAQLRLPFKATVSTSRLCSSCIPCRSSMTIPRRTDSFADEMNIRVDYSRVVLFEQTAIKVLARAISADKKLWKAPSFCALRLKEKNLVAWRQWLKQCWSLFVITKCSYSSFIDERIALYLPASKI